MWEVKLFKLLNSQHLLNSGFFRRLFRRLFGRLEVGDAGCDKEVVPRQEFLDVGGVDALAVILGEYLGEIFAEVGVIADSLDVDGLAFVFLLYGVEYESERGVAFLGVDGYVG